MQFTHHGAWFLRALEDGKEGREDGRSAEAGYAGPFLVACSWHEMLQGPRVTHTICPSCMKRVLDELDART